MTRDKRICFRLTEEEFDFIQREVEEAMTTASAYVHEAVKEKIKRDCNG